MKKEYSVYEAKARLSEIIRTVRQHHEVVITDRSKPVVRVVAIDVKKPKSLRDRLDELVRTGQISERQERIHLPQPTPNSGDVLSVFLRERE